MALRPACIAECKIGQAQRSIGDGECSHFAAGERRHAFCQLRCASACRVCRIALQCSDPVYRRKGDRDAGNTANHGHGKPPPGVGSCCNLGCGHEGRNLGRRAMSNKMWGGRFRTSPDAVMEDINASVDFDRHLFRQDIAASQAHAAMLAKQGIITADDARKIAHGLDTILSEIESGRFKFKRALEDIHMNVESRLAELIGPVAGRLHTARSRNDQVATDLRLWLRGAIDRLDPAMRDLQEALIDRAELEAATVMPGYTHLQIAQPVTLGHHLLAYVEMLGRDRSRLADCRRRLNECPLGAAALAGTSFPIDRAMTATALGFDRPTANSLDGVADRDFALEFMAAAAVTGMHLSRFAEEIVIWCRDAFG